MERLPALVGTTLGDLSQQGNTVQNGRLLKAKRLLASASDEFRAELLGFEPADDDEKD